MANKKHLNYYDTHFVSPEILSRAQGITPTLYGIRKVQEYQKLGIRYFANKSQFATYFEHSSIANNKAKLNQFWEEYQERDKIIASGEYSHIRDDIFKETYIKAVEKSLKIGDSARETFLRGLKMMNTKAFMQTIDILPVIPSFYMEAGELVSISNGAIDLDTLNKQLGFKEKTSLYKEYINNTDFYNTYEDYTVSSLSHEIGFSSATRNYVQTHPMRVRQLTRFLLKYKIKPNLSNNGVLTIPFVRKNEQAIAVEIYTRIKEDA